MFTRIVNSISVLALVAYIGEIHCSDISLESVCTNQTVTLESISKTRDLIKQNEQQPLEACDSYKQSLSELDEVLAVVETGQVCSLDLVDKIRNYHLKFIQTSQKDGFEPGQKRDNIPEPLRLFFISLCFQISAECKMNLINNLEYDTKEVISAKDYEQIRLLEKYDVTILDDAGEISDFDDILLLDDLEENVETAQAIRQSEIAIKVSTNNFIRQLLGMCKNKFRPFYERLILPLVKLSNLGYNYQGELLERELEELRKNELIKRWYNIVQICESLSMIKIYEDPDRVVESDGSLLGVVTFVDANSDVSSGHDRLKLIDNYEPDLYKYEPFPSHNSDILWIKNQNELDKLVKRYRTSVNEADRIRSKLVRKIAARIKELISSGRVLMLARELTACYRQNICETKDSNVNSEVLMMIDDAVNQDELEKGVIVQSDEQPVSWRGTKERGMTIRKTDKPMKKVRPIPPMPRRIKPFEDQTKTSKKVSRLLDRFKISRWSMFFSLLAILGILMIVLAIHAG